MRLSTILSAFALAVSVQAKCFQNYKDRVCNLKHLGDQGCGEHGLHRVSYLELITLRESVR
jgi:hypothetical protein